MKLYYAPGACSIGIHVLLEEVGKPYQLEPVNLREGAQFKPPFTGVSPKGKVPALERDDGSVLTEYPVIARWLGHQANLLPKDAEADIRAMEAMEYAVGTMHGQGFARLFRTERFAPSVADHDAVKAAGREVVEKGFAVLDNALAGKSYIAGNDFSAADTALFYVEFWATKRLGMRLPANCAAHFDRMMTRPAVQRTLQQEGQA
ncbi:MAG: glutathione S-transferase N-terminal domain-containing protein [Alphaproteobacteria bacterium]|nr:glutathione S-transferase N-terminal domain-containing protein [Alphaproteobacteria bacterium]